MFPWKLKRVIHDYLQERFFLIVLVLILFVMGVIFGGCGAGSLKADQKTDLLNYLHQGLQSSVLIPDHLYTKQTIINNLETVFFLFLMGISVIGIPLALLLIFTRGFIFGFSLGFLLQNLGAKGAALSLIGILPHNFFILPALFLMVVAMLDCATALMKIRMGPSQKRVVLGAEIGRCALLTLIVLVMIALGGFIQGYVTPLLTTWIAALL